METRDFTTSSKEMAKDRYNSTNTRIPPLEFYLFSISAVAKRREAMSKVDDKASRNDYDGTKVTLSAYSRSRPDRGDTWHFTLPHRPHSRLTMSDLESSRDQRLNDALHGDEEALATMLIDYRPYLRLLAQRDLDSAINARVDPSDIVQQTCLEVCRDFSDFKGRTEPAFIAWIKRILQNNVAESIHCHITTQKRSVRRERNLNAKQDSDALPIYIDSRQSSPSQRAMKGERIVELASKLDTLPEMQKEALRLRYLEGMTLQTISDRMDRSNMAVAGLLKRGLQQLRQELRDKD